MPGGYRYALSEAASEYRLPAPEQMRLVFACRLLTNTPHRQGDYATTDETGRVLQNLLTEDWVLTYWVDHAASEVRIVEVAQV